jgi:hypothetical protein
MGGEAMGGVAMGGEAMGGVAMGGEAMGGDAMGGEAMGGVAMGGEAMGGEVAVDAPEIEGSYTDQYAGSHVITAQTWEQAYEGSMPSIFTFVSVDNEGDYLIAQNAETNEYFPNMWSRLDWFFDGEDTWFCQTVYDGGTREVAEMAEKPDTSSPSESGCGQSNWSQLIPVE